MSGEMENKEERRAGGGARGKVWLEQEEARAADPLGHGPLACELREHWGEHPEGKAPVEVEIGFGYGHFLLQYAAKNPELRLVGFEVKAQLAGRVSRRKDRLGYENLTIIRGDARRLMPVLFAPGSLRAVHIQFPDPWWKKRHHRRRLVEPSFVTLLHRLLEESGRIFLRTDVRAYGEAMIASFEDGSGRFENLAGQGRFAEDDGLGIPSNRERRYVASGTPVFRLVYVRK